MKASELIKELEVHHNMYGDIDVVVSSIWMEARHKIKDTLIISLEGSDKIVLRLED